MLLDLTNVNLRICYTDEEFAKVPEYIKKYYSKIA